MTASKSMVSYRGRYGSMTKEARETIIKAVRAGCYLEIAAALAGVGRETLYRWLREGADLRHGEKAEFRREVSRALAESEMRDVLNIKSAAQSGQWQASAWRLERRVPERWARRDPQKGLVGAEKIMEIVGKIVVAINKIVKNASERDAIVRELTRISEELKAEAGIEL